MEDLSLGWINSLAKAPALPGALKKLGQPMIGIKKRFFVAGAPGRAHESPLPKALLNRSSATESSIIIPKGLISVKDLDGW